MPGIATPNRAPSTDRSRRTTESAARDRAMVTRLLTLMTLAPYRRRLDVAAEVFDATPSEVGIERRLLQFEVAGAHPLLLHDEPVYRSATLAGHTTSGGRGFRTGVSLCFAYMQCGPGTPRSALLEGVGYEIGVAGERFPLRALARPVYDPGGARLRS